MYIVFSNAFCKLTASKITKDLMKVQLLEDNEEKDKKPEEG
jgi:hypothetical protein